MEATATATVCSIQGVDPIAESRDGSSAAIIIIADTFFFSFPIIPLHTIAPALARDYQQCVRMM